MVKTPSVAEVHVLVTVLVSTVETRGQEIKSKDVFFSCPLHLLTSCFCRLGSSSRLGADVLEVDRLPLDSALRGCDVVGELARLIDRRGLDAEQVFPIGG